MSLNIKNEHVHTLAREAARLTGASQTSAIEAALTRYLDELQKQRSRGVDDRRARIDTTLADVRARLQAAGVTELRTDDLYDETGLPR